MPDPGDRRFLASLEGLRGIAALAIVVFHLRHEIAVLLDGLVPGGTALLQPLMLKSRLAVDLFFILSGFILCHVYLGARAPVTAAAWRRYLAFRIARIFPLHLFMLALWLAYTLLLVTLVHPQQAFAERIGGLGEVVERVFLVHMWWRGQTPLTLNATDWSISVEWALYLIFPLLVAALLHVSRARDGAGRELIPAGAALALLAAAFAAAYAVIVFQVSPIYGKGYIWVLRGGCEFLAGVALWQLWARGHGGHAAWRRLGAPLALAGAIAACYLTDNDWWVLPGLALLLFAEAGRAHDPGAGDGLLGRPAVLWLGQVSYALYLGHLLVLQSLSGLAKYGGPRLLGADPGTTAPIATAALVVAAGVGLSLGFAALLHHWVEVPARRRLRAWADARGGEARHA